jgi:hypothetical protein
MTAKANHSIQLRSCPSPLVLFGIDSRGKPKGARFGREHASLAIKAATQLQLNVLASNDPRVAEIVARLPVGRVHATGRTFVPFIRRDLYDQLVAAAPNGNLRQPLTPPPSGATGGAAGRGRLGRRLTCRGLGTRSGSATLSSPKKKIQRMVGTRPSSSKLRTTCSRCAGATTRGFVGLRAIGCGSACSIRDHRLANKQSRNPQNTKAQPPRSSSPVCPPIGKTSTSTSSSSPKMMARSGRGGRQHRSRRLVTLSNCGGATTARCHRSAVNGLRSP